MAIPSDERFRLDVPDDAWLMQEAASVGWEYLGARDVGVPERGDRGIVEYDFLNARGQARCIALVKARIN